MPENNRPRARQKTVSSGGTGVHRRENGLGTGPVGSGGGFHGGSSGGGGGVSKAAIGGGGIGLIAIIVALLNFLGGGGSSQPDSGISQDNTAAGSSSYSAPAVGKLDRTVAEGSRPKYLQMLGNSEDKVTIMMYMCGTDLESKHGMASADIQEMAAATLGSNVDIIIYTGGCKQWKMGGISNSVNQIYKLENGKLRQLEDNMGSKAMTDPSTLAQFIQYCSKNYPANRNELIFWDHGGGSVSGFGYDEKNSQAGSMGIDGIAAALRAGGVKFDFIGFDACLMATAETALALGEHADYMIASEETEPGIGWYYTEWLTEFGKNTSMPTIDIGKLIVDGFIDQCARRCPSSGTTLSVIDLAEFTHTVPDKLAGFSRSVTDIITKKDYKTVSNARYGTREFAKSSKIDQVDLVDLADRMNTAEGKELGDAVKGAVKYNLTSRNMTKAYGVSIFFPYNKTKYVDRACSTYQAIGMNDEYSRAIKQFASIEASGQAATGGTQSPVQSLFDLGGGSGGAELIGQLLSGFLSGSDRSVDGLDDENTDFLNDNPLSEGETAEYISANYFDPTALVWREEDGNYVIELTESQWELVHDTDLNMFYDDGNGYVNLGLDNIFTIEGNELIADTDRDWISINNQPVSYFRTDTTELDGGEYVISGYVPVLLNGERASLILRFDNEHPEGIVAGVTDEYVDGETDTVAKSMTELQDGDKIDFICEYYTYDGKYQDSYPLGTTITINGDLKITNTDVGSGNVRLLYRFTDIYNQEYWSEAIIV